MAKGLELWFAKFQFGLEPRIKMYRRLSAFIKQGVPLYTAMDKFSKLYGKKKGDPRSIALQSWMAGVQKGRPFSDALDGWAPASEVMLIESGESGGDLPGAFEKAIEVTEAQRMMKKAIIGGLAYPFIVLLVLLAMLFMFSLNVVPQLAEFIPPEEWPGASAGLYVMSTLVQSYGIISIFVAIALIVFIIKTMPKWQGGVRAKFDVAPPWSIYRAFQSSILLVSLSALMQTGTPLRTALTKLMSKSDPYVKAHIAKMLSQLAAGRGNGAALDTGMLSKEIADDLTLYGEVADFESAMDSIGKEAIDSGVQNIKTASSVVGTVILIATGVFTGWIYFGFYTLTSSIAA